MAKTLRYPWVWPVACLEVLNVSPSRCFFCHLKKMTNTLVNFLKSRIQISVKIWKLLFYCTPSILLENVRNFKKIYVRSIKTILSLYSLQILRKHIIKSDICFWLLCGIRKLLRLPNLNGPYSICMFVYCI